MNRFLFFATLASFAMVAMGCTREKPPGPDTTPPPQNVTVSNTPISIPTSAPVRPVSPTGSGVAPASGITSTAPITVPVDRTRSPSTSTAVTPTLSLPPGIFSPLPPLGPTTGAPAVTPNPTANLGLPSAAPTAPTTYTIQWGDWLSKIARQFGVSNEAIIAANPSVNPNLLLPGRVLNIPGSGGTVLSPAGTPPTTTPGSGPTTYTVQRGDWFSAIARKFGVTFEALVAANPGENPNIVFPGQILNIPGSGTAPSPIAPNPPATGGATPTGKPARYAVQQGDTLSSIAIRFNTTIYALQIANHLPSPQFIYVGQVLIIPK